MWLGFATTGTIWILPFSGYWLVQGSYFPALAGLSLCLACIPVFLGVAPWKRPDTRLWKLLLLPYGFFLGAVLLLIYVFTRFEDLSRIQYGIWLLPCFGLFFTLGYRTWNDLRTKPRSTSDP